VDQRYNGGQWNSLGEFDLAPGQNHRVSLSAVVGERTVADGVRFVPIADARMVQADAVKIVPNTAEDALYVHADQLGTPRKLTDPTGAVVWDASLTPYGLEDSIAGTETLDSRFPGQWADAESGLNYNYFRDYDPTTGRYLQSDPIGLRGGLNTFAYVGGNPINYTDPKGQYAETPLDIWFIVYDVYRLTNDNVIGNCGNLGENLLALGADLLGALIPGATGLGLGVRSIDDIAALAARNADDVARGGSKSLKDQAADLIPQNANKNRATLRSPGQKMEVDLAGKSHGGVQTPHTKISPRNSKAPNQPAYNTKSSPVRPATQQNIRTVRKFLKRQGRK